ncbi:MAG: FeoB-associated Cys-rich membrane protein [Acidobacteria bacterium]|nr:FeoB-associated Cys-rich membrane protein [Acidobacteriota bacterium]
MNWQVLIVGIIIFIALFYVGTNVWRKVKSFSGKSSCGTDDCGCGTKSSAKKSFVQIGKT